MSSKNQEILRLQAELASLQAEVASLQEENIVLQQKSSALSQKGLEKDRKIVEMDKTIESMRATIDSLLNMMAWFRKKMFGKMSEKHLPIDPAQLSLFSTESISEEQKAEADKASAKTDLAITKAIAVKEKPARRSLDTTGLPIVETYIYPEGTTDKEGNFFLSIL